MNDKAKAILDKMEATISKIAGLKVEVTIRGENEWTVSALGEHDFERVREFFKSRIHNWEIDYDSELNETFSYFNLI